MQRQLTFNKSHNAKYLELVSSHAIVLCDCWLSLYCRLLRGVTTKMECAQMTKKKIALSPFFDSILDISVAAKPCFFIFY